MITMTCDALLCIAMHCALCYNEFKEKIMNKELNKDSLKFLISSLVEQTKSISYDLSEENALNLLTSYIKKYGIPRCTWSFRRKMSVHMMNQINENCSLSLEEINSLIDSVVKMLVENNEDMDEEGAVRYLISTIKETVKNQETCLKLAA